MQVLTCLSQQTTGLYDHEKEGCRFEQFTGLHDKNGKEIYEGDIICRRAMRNTFVEYERCRWVLRYDDPKVEWRQDLHNQISLHLEVIGNIYENPELLNP